MPWISTRSKPNPTHANGVIFVLCPAISLQLTFYMFFLFLPMHPSRASQVITFKHAKYTCKYYTRTQIQNVVKYVERVIFYRLVCLHFSAAIIKSFCLTCSKQRSLLCKCFYSETKWNMIACRARVHEQWYVPSFVYKRRAWRSALLFSSAEMKHLWIDLKISTWPRT